MTIVLARNASLDAYQAILKPEVWSIFQLLFSDPKHNPWTFEGYIHVPNALRHAIGDGSEKIELGEPRTSYDAQRGFTGLPYRISVDLIYRGQAFQDPNCLEARIYEKGLPIGTLHEK
jgi:hypothetical protein